MPSHPTSIWRRSPNKLRQSEIWQECFYFTSLFLAALILFLVNLGNLPLIDSHEGLIAQVAREIYRGSNSFSHWMFPTLWGEPYLAQPPLVQDLIAIAYRIAGVSEVTTRLPGALLGACSVVLLYGIGREIFVARFPALFSALVYLTSIPVIRLGRLAMSDGPFLCFELLTIWAILRSRRDLRWSLVAGFGLALMSLTKGLISLPILALVIAFLLWDTPRLLTSFYFLGGIFLGIAPGIGYYVARWFHFHDFGNGEKLFNLFLNQISASNFNFQLPPQYYLIQGLQYILPWFLVTVAGIRLASRNLHWGWGKLSIVWLVVYSILVFLVLDRNYWSIVPIYPALALVTGKQLDLTRNLPSYVDYPPAWTYGFALMAVLATFAGLHWGIRDYIDFYLPFICGSLAITFAATAIVIAQQETQFIPLLFWGLFVSIFLLIISPHWIWELKTVEPVKPIAELVRQYTPEKQIIYSSMERKRSSLEFYSDRQIIPLETKELKYIWQQENNVFFLLDSSAIQELNVTKDQLIKDPQFNYLHWKLAVRKSPII